MNASSGPRFGKQNRQSGINRLSPKEPETAYNKKPKGRCCIITVVRWPWRSVSAKECVTTQRPNALALKIDESISAVSYGLHTCCIRVGLCELAKYKHM